MNNKDLSLPGEYLASIEEFFPGEGVYEYNGNVYSSSLGKIVYNLKERKISVQPFKRPSNYLKRGFTVICKVTHIAKNLVELKILYIEDTKTNVNLTGYLQIKRKQDSFKEETSILKNEDYVRARVLTVEGNIFLSLRGRNYGVIYAECPNCTSHLYSVKKQRNLLICRECGYSRKAKVSTNYIYRILKS